MITTTTSHTAHSTVTITLTAKQTVTVTARKTLKDSLILELDICVVGRGKSQATFAFAFILANACSLFNTSTAFSSLSYTGCNTSGRRQVNQSTRSTRIHTNSTHSPPYSLLYIIQHELTYHHISHKEQSQPSSSSSRSHMGWHAANLHNTCTKHNFAFQKSTFKPLL